MEKIKSLYIDLFQNPMGRISRGDFWLIYIFQFTIWIFIALNFENSFFIVFPALYMAISGLILQIKRYHDSGRSGWWLIVPIVNFVLLFFDSDEDNKWGSKSNL